MQSAAAYPAAVAAHATTAAPVPADDANMQQQRTTQLRAFAPYRKAPPRTPAEEQKQKARADERKGSPTPADDDDGDDNDPNALLTDEHIDFLLHHHMRTRQAEAGRTKQMANEPEDILFAPAARWPVGGVFPRALLQQLQTRLCAGMQSTCCSGTALWRRAARLTYLPVCPDVDRLLGGGLLQGEVTELVAASCAGKTQFCLQAATMAAMRGQRVHVIDTSCTFDMARGQQMAKEIERAAGRKPPSQGDWQPLSHITIATAFTASGVLDLLEHLRRSLESRQPAPHLLIIDSLGGVIGPIVGAAKGRGHEIMMHILRLVKAIAFEFDIAVLTTNYTVSSSDRDRDATMQREPTQTTKMPALGESWWMLADTRVMLDVDFHASTSSSSAARERKIVKITLQRSQRKLAGETIVCALESAGFVSQAAAKPAMVA